MVDEDRRKRLWEEAEKLGEDEIRLRLVGHVYGEQTKPYIEEWLRRKERSRSEERKRLDESSQAEMAEATSRAAMAAERAAAAAEEQARAAERASTAAERAASAAEVSATEARRQSRNAHRANIIAAIALVIAAISLAVTAYTSWFSHADDARVQPVAQQVKPRQ
jgi:hypothetical protein